MSLSRKQETISKRFPLVGARTSQPLATAGYRDSSTEKEFGASSSTAKKAVSLRHLLKIWQRLGRPFSGFQPKHIFNCDETSLFWRQIPDRSLATRSIPGRKKGKSRITALFCCNTDGSEKMDPGSLARPKTPGRSQAFALKAIA